MMSNDLLALLYFICVNVHCLNSAAYVEVVAFNDETFFFLIRLSKSIYKFGCRFIGQHIGYRPKFSYRCIPNIFLKVPAVHSLDNCIDNSTICI